MLCAGEEIMNRSGGRPKAVDIWEHVIELEGKQVKCKYCGFVFAASANRIKSHIYQITGNGIRTCTCFPPPNNSGSNKTVIKDPKENLIHSQETQHQERIHVGPFLVTNTLDEHDLQLIQYGFDLTPNSGTYMVFQSSRSFLNQFEFSTLKPLTLLDSLIIDIFAEILTDNERKKKIKPSNWYLPVTFSSAALSGDVSSFLDFVERQNIRKNYMSDLINCEKMFIPVHVGKNSHGHFYLYIIHLKNQEVQLWDSLSNQFIEENERSMTTQKLLLALDELFLNDRRGTDLPFTKFYWTMAFNTLLQPNEYDCGIFVINFMQQSTNYVKRNPSFQFDSDQERLDLALKLLKSDLNQERDILYDKAGQRHYAQDGSEQDSDLCGIKRKCLNTCKALSKDVRRGAYIELDDSNRRVKSNVGVEKGYKLPTPDLVGEEFQSYTEQIWEWLMKDEVAIIGVWGMAGVGKTTLVTHIHNKLLEENNSDFDHIIWVTVSQNHSISHMQKVMARSIDLDISDEYEVKRIAGKLLHAFKHMNKCVLILDDVWGHIFLEEVGFPILHDGIKLILTTRLREVCQSMDCKNIIKVKPLSPNGSWSLFKRTFGVRETLSCEVEKIARALTWKCEGLPLAIVTIARRMKGKEDVRQWNHMLESLKNLENGQYDMDKWVFPALRSSYAHLDNKLQGCFLYCAALHAKYEYNCVNAKERTRRFVYEEWIDRTRRLVVQCNEYHSIMDKFYSSSLLEVSYDLGWRMHKLVRVMAIKETDKIMAKAYMHLAEIPEDSKWEEDLQKVFLTGNNIPKIPDGMSPRCSKLSTLLLNGNHKLEFIPDDFFFHMPTLRVLDISRTSIRHLPTSVSNLESLVALLLSRCKSLSNVPSLAKLQRLISLDLSYTAITKAPPGLELLINLRRLYLEGTEKLKMSTSLVIPKLTNLQSLSLGCIPKSMDVGAQDLQGLKKLEAVSANFCDIEEFNAYVTSLLSRHHGLEYYSFKVSPTNAYGYEFEEFSSGKNSQVLFQGMELGNSTIILPEDVKDLRIVECHQWTRSMCLCNFLSFSKQNSVCEIESVKISWCDKLVYLFCCSSSCSFCSSVQLVKALDFWDLRDLQNIVAPLALPFTNLFCHLRYLRIYRCNSVKTLFTPELSTQLLKLDTMYIGNCESMEEIVSHRSGQEDLFEMLLHNYAISLPKLSSVRLEKLPKLNSVYRGIMLCPSLRSFYSRNCKKLIAPRIKKIIYGDALQIKETPDGYLYGDALW